MADERQAVERLRSGEIRTRYRGGEDGEKDSPASLLMQGRPYREMVRSQVGVPVSPKSLQHMVRKGEKAHNPRVREQIVEATRLTAEVSFPGAKEAIGEVSSPNKPVVVSKSLLGKMVIKALYEDFAKHGPEVIDRLRRTDAFGYMTVVMRMIPRSVEVDVGQNLVGLLEELQKRDGGVAKVIDGVAKGEVGG